MLVSWVTARLAAVGGPPPARRVRGCAASRGRGTGAAGFTLVELLTVIAIVGILGTLLLSALNSAQKKSWQARCTANLRQVSLALNMYLDDFDRRPGTFRFLVHTRYLPAPGIFLCPADRTGNWGGLVNPPDIAAPPAGAAVALPPGPADETAFGGGPVGSPDTPFAAPLAYSYLHPLGWSDGGWERLVKTGNQAGWAVCQLHGLGKPHPEVPSIYDYQGLVFRAQRDGAVVRRSVFWAADVRAAWPPPPEFDGQVGMAQPNALAGSAAGAAAWMLLSDGPVP